MAIGDVHADKDALVTLLRQAALIGPKDTKWTGKDTYLVLTGDMVDRGPNSAAVLDLLMELEGQAQKAGGRLLALIGNHESMNFFGDLRYVTPEDVASYRTKNSEKIRAQQVEFGLEQMKLNGMPPADEEAWRREYTAQLPLGFVEQRLAFLATGKYGKWLLRQNAVIRINDALFMHGGMSAKYVDRELADINETIRKELSTPLDPAIGISKDEEGPLWYRGLALNAETDEATKQLVGRALENFGVKHIVLGHTPQALIVPRFEGRVILIDVGLSKAFDSMRAFLLIEDGKYYAVHRGNKLELPLDGSPSAINQYLGAANRLEPQDSRLRSLVEKAAPTAR